MTIHGLTVCVEYAEFLARGIARWMAGLASLTVVTTEGDTETQRLARQHGARLHVTDAFYRDGAAFNKGRAMEDARRSMPWSDWILFFDADVVPPADWMRRLTSARAWSLHGCRRFEANRSMEDIGQPDIPGDVPGVGFFQLFHSGDPLAQDTPLLETHWTHGGNYDNALMDRWRTKGRPIQTLPFRLAHIGERHNWFGRGRVDAFTAMQAERARLGGWQHERIEVRA